MSRTSRGLSSFLLRSRARAGLAVAGVLAVGVLAGCSGSDEPTTTSAGLDAADAPAEGADGGAEEAPAAGSGTADEATGISQASLAAVRRQIMTAGLVVEVENVLSAARQAESIAVGVGGFVTDEDTQVERRAGPTGDSEVAAVTVSSLTVRVPPTALDDALGRLAELGSLVSQNRATTDVTDEYVDVEARLDSQRASLDRLLQLVGTAGGLDDVISLENEIARRQADLDGLAARLQSLEEQTDLATIALTLTSARDAVAGPEPEAGFLAGLEDGWSAFTGSVVAALTVVGALLPFAVLAALLAIPLLALRRRRTRAVGPPPEAPAATPTAPA